ncbi:MAG TPA: sigma-70 family RNA polymerase sigma factor [Dinghuibacter sp.]|jgi:RNA polymerase sigma factor (sigma-70 family)|uniref:RNA polymerase sigma factor n=1 Tax=Dinghuibacter sp. TaxID=2024697 RepID=UPI002C9EE5B3|nr:sigma-70 family RNA polymerase sigma factor [Dinghuibacter sp.]HTJ14314.1 sigma-70 family RNA polymerase sigma factor [Dinghuibacter sp.]
MENQVWALVAGGDQEAYGRLYIHYYRRLYNYGRKFTDDAALLEDSLQEALLSVWTGRARLTRIESPHTYLLTTFRYILFKKLKQRPHTRSASEGDQDPDFGIEHFLILKDSETEKKEQLQKAIERLTGRQREAIFLRFYEGLSYEEIAGVMGISVKATYKVMARALEQLRSTLSVSMATLFLLLATPA